MKKCYVANVANARRNPMTSKPRLGKGCHGGFLNDEFTISGRQLLAILLFVFIFFVVCFTIKGPTYGVL